jgi:hypothetical protein
MIHYLLDQKGMRSGVHWYYSIRHHGPYSHEFEQSLLNAILFARLCGFLCGVAERFCESFPEGGWNFHTIRVVPGH